MNSSEVIRMNQLTPLKTQSNPVIDGILSSNQQCLSIYYHEVSELGHLVRNLKKIVDERRELTVTIIFPYTDLF